MYIKSGDFVCHLYPQKVKTQKNLIDPHTQLHTFIKECTVNGNENFTT